MTLPPAPTARLSCDGAIATVVIDRESKLNAIGYATIDTLLGIFDKLESNDVLRAVTLTGAGERAFSAGADIPGLAASNAAASGNVSSHLHRFLARKRRREASGQLANSATQ